MVWNKGVTLPSHLAHLLTRLLIRLEATAWVMELRPRPRVGNIASHVSSHHRGRPCSHTDHVMTCGPTCTPALVTGADGVMSPVIRVYCT